MKSKLLVILGPTSTGKTDLALEIAKKTNGEIISADSRQVYKYLDLGTGKLPNQNVKVNKYDMYWEMDGIKVWMYDVLNPEIRFNLYDYINKSHKIIKEIEKAGKLPILVGGTGFYIRSLIEGFSDFGKQEDTNLREKLEKLSLEQIKKKIQQIDPGILPNLNNSELNNKRRLIRLIEKRIFPAGGSEVSFQGLKKEFNILKIGLTANRPLLRERIQKRVVKRIAEGMIKEAKDLVSEGKLSFERMDELGLEYRYLAKLLKEEVKNEEEFIRILSLRIGQFAKRQQTWFKKERNVIWFDTGDKDYFNKVEIQILDWYNSP